MHPSGPKWSPQQPPEPGPHSAVPGAPRPPGPPDWAPAQPTWGSPDPGAFATPPAGHAGGPPEPQQGWGRPDSHQPWGPPDPRQAWAPPDPSTRKRTHRPWTILLVALVTLGTLGIAVLAAAPPAGLPGGNAATLVGADGYGEVQVDEAGLYTQIEWAHLDGARVFSGPFEFYWVMDEMEFDEALSTRWIRQTRTDMLGEQTYRLFSMDDDGLRQRLNIEREVTQYFPGRLSLPADIAAGATWQSEGMVSVADAPAEPYVTIGRASAAPEVAEECLRVDLEETIGANAPTIESGVWCPERGLVVDGSWHPGTLDLEPRGGIEMDWNPESWTVHQPEPMQVVGGAPLVITPISPPLGVAGRALPIGTSQDVVTFDSNWLINGVSHSGGQLTAAAQAGDLTLTATSLRTITATNPRNWRRWQISTTDVAEQLVQTGADHFIAVDSSGSVSMHSLDDGAQVWSGSYPGAAEKPVMVAGDYVFLVSGDAEVTVLDWRSGDSVATIGLPDSIRTIGAGPDTVAVFGFSGRVWAYAADGTPRWVTSLQEGAGDGVIAVTQNEVVVGGDFSLTGLSLDTGKVAWAYNEPTEQLVTDGETVVAYGDEYLAVYRDGVILHHWGWDNPLLVSDYYCRGLTDGVTCVNGNGEIVEVRP